jgi:hypothetical protein
VAFVTDPFVAEDDEFATSGTLGTLGQHLAKRRWGVLPRSSGHVRDIADLDLKELARGAQGFVNFGIARFASRNSLVAICHEVDNNPDD